MSSNNEEGQRIQPSRGTANEGHSHGHSNVKHKVISVIGDVETVTGFILTGSAEINKEKQKNYFIYDKETSLGELEDVVRGFLNRDDIAVLLIVQYIAESVRHILENHTKITPAILEIPNKEHAYDPSKDYILKKAHSIISADDLK